MRRGSASTSQMGLDQLRSREASLGGGGMLGERDAVGVTSPGAHTPRGGGAGGMRAAGNATGAQKRAHARATGFSSALMPGRSFALFRSERMVHVRLYFDRAAARTTVEELGDTRLFEFQDLNPETSAFQRSFAADVRRCDEMMRKLNYLKAQVLEHDRSALDKSAYDNFDEDEDEGLSSDVRGAALKHTSSESAIGMDDLNHQLESLEKGMQDMNRHDQLLKMQFHQYVEMRLVMDFVAELFLDESRLSLQRKRREQVRSDNKGTIQAKIGELLDPIMHRSSLLDDVEVEEPSALSVGPAKHFGANGADTASGDNRRPKFRTGSSESPSLSYFCGMIESSSLTAYERMIFRISRGNAIVRVSRNAHTVFDPETSETMSKRPVVVFYSGDELKNKIIKTSQAYRATLYTIPVDSSAQEVALARLEERMRDVEAVLESSARQRNEILGQIARDLAKWEATILREKAVFHCLNLLNFDTSVRLFLAEGWCPEASIPEIEQALEEGRRRSNSQVASLMEQQTFREGSAPTYFRLNKFTEVFHSIVESYGIAEYGEVNPAPFLVVTFPFLFAVMFGDIGHGILMAMYALYLILAERRLARKALGEMVQMTFQGRYIIFLMGVFSIYTGFIYNEFFAVPLDLFGTRWFYSMESKMACGVDNCKDPALALPPLVPYPFGFDPIWKSSQTGLVYFNSYKMKLSIVLGVCQMFMGLVLSAENARYFARPLDFFCEFVPQAIFLLSIFGYLVVLIFFKWNVDWTAVTCDPDGLLACGPPDLKSILIGMIMSPGSVPRELSLFPMQAVLQNVLMLAALISVPWMLFPKPFILRARSRTRRGYSALEERSANEFVLDDEAAAGASGGDDDSGDKAPFDFQEIMVHQMIHTIEFVLGAVSNTASYLRLWALSLAHAQLSDVFLEKLVMLPYEAGSVVGMAIGACLWLAATIGVLMLMESLSAFLHALRLHWVEFQNKFYNLHGSGHKFAPFEFRRAASPADE
ncbi:V-type proton ATPase subunit a2 [Porphyridium purpureum]|uniref:V-type proton ATPase subunit a n=1 Tax=Porphyridium purpureum TaxID=35688 RepID=A0A5J4YWI5_PORPP|nr:V-type proton ATPase subunit a2 [Porphyridium purpureum]|eukprot:POR0353..scf227_4